MNEEDRQNPPPEKKAISRRRFQVSLATALLGTTAIAGVSAFIGNARRKKEWQELQKSLGRVDEYPFINKDRSTAFFIDEDKTIIAPHLRPKKLDVYNDRIEMTIAHGDRFIYKLSAPPLPPHSYFFSIHRIPSDVEIILHDFKSTELTLSFIPNAEKKAKVILEGNVHAYIKPTESFGSGNYGKINTPWEISGLTDGQLARARQELQKIARKNTNRIMPTEIIVELSPKNLSPEQEREFLVKSLEEMIRIQRSEMMKGYFGISTGLPLTTIDCGEGFSFDLRDNISQVLVSKTGNRLDCLEVMEAEKKRYKDTPAHKEAYLKEQEEQKKQEKAFQDKIKETKNAPQTQR